MTRDLSKDSFRSSDRGSPEPTWNEGPLDSRIKVTVFDCDGVLFDSREANVHFYNHVLEHVGRPAVRPEQEEFIHMHAVRDSLAFLIGPGPLLEKALDYCQSFDFSRFNRYLKVEPGLEELLAALRGRYHVVLATNRTVSTRQLLADFNLERFFDHLVTAADVTHPKPHPESMQRIMNRFSAEPREILFVGDSPVDEQLARATGVFFAAYKNPALQAHFHIQHFGRLKDLLVPETET
ncbi:HAD family hydrolase [Desulfoglaeba alkanexedens]|uniref:phosphoglycolate phosphatase n=1 Tax=Desulfoglaeba alkanexedens ALDC TaxID=980445 RepID=A0A4V1ER88_9BACT|nr:HAD-IA family hydrolase [Desulfoglaeba alkanexedens]QCQ20791.1 HAD family hydrolase [Desulfoglaeba alkanexedens ALDC]